MQYVQAITVLRKMQSAAPPTAAARLGDVIELVIALYDENAALKSHAPPPEPPPAVVEPLPAPAVDVLLPALTVLRGQVSAVRLGKLGKLNSEQEAALRLAEQQADAAFAMIDSLDLLAKLSGGTLDIQLEPFDCAVALRRAWERVREKADARGHQVALRTDDPLPAVVGDRGRVVTILADLLENAVLYTPFGGTIRITADTLGTHVLFGIEDTGIGIDADEPVGEPFWRGMTHPLVRQHPGAGLRVYLARQMLVMMGGELFFSGEPGEGSTFSFTLPAVR